MKRFNFARITKVAEEISDEAKGAFIGGYSGYRGSKDKQKGENHIGSHAAKIGAGGAVLGGAVGHQIDKSRHKFYMKNRSYSQRVADAAGEARKGKHKVAKALALGYGLVGAASGAMAYKSGRMVTKDKKKEK